MGAGSGPKGACTENKGQKGGKGGSGAQGGDLTVPKEGVLGGPHARGLAGQGRAGTPSGPVGIITCTVVAPRGSIVAQGPTELGTVQTLNKKTVPAPLWPVFS